MLTYWHFAVPLLLLLVSTVVPAQPHAPQASIPAGISSRVAANIEALDSSDPHVRAAAALELGGAGDSGRVAIPRLLEMLDDYEAGSYPNPFGGMGDWCDCPAKRAARALAQIGGPAVDSLLLRYKTCNSDERRFAVYALTLIDDPRTTPCLIDFLKTTQTDQAAQFPFYNGQFSELFPPNHPFNSSWIKFEILNALGERGDTSAVELLIDISYDSSFSHRNDAIDALAKIGDRRAVEPLIGLLDSPDCVGRAAHALAVINDYRAVEPLFARLKDSTGAYNGSIMAALGDFKSDKALEAIIPALKDPEWVIRYCAALAIGANGGGWCVHHPIEYRRPRAKGREAAVLPLIEALKDTVPGVRQEVMYALAAIGDRRAIMPLFEIMQLKTPMDDWWAKDALIQLTGEDFRQYDGGNDKWQAWLHKWILDVQHK